MYESRKPNITLGSLLLVVFCMRVKANTDKGLLTLLRDQQTVNP